MEQLFRNFKLQSRMLRLRMKYFLILVLLFIFSSSCEESLEIEQQETKQLKSIEVSI